MRKLGMCVPMANGGDIFDKMSVIKGTGFDTCFFSWYPETDFSAIKHHADSIGLEIETIHAPFGKANSMWDESTNEGDYFTEELKKSIRAAGNNGIPYVIIHVCMGNDAPISSRIGLARFEKLVVEAEKYGVKLAFENLEFPRLTALILDYFKCDTVGFCYDTGHENCFTPGYKFLPMFGDRLFCTHIHDNLSTRIGEPYYRNDLHKIPFDGIIDFESICKDIKKTGYTGSLMLEVCYGGPNHYGDISFKEFVEKSYASAIRLRKLTDGE